MNSVTIPLSEVDTLGPTKIGAFEDCLGLWSREVLEEPIGELIDTTTRVFWLQTASSFADIRIPANRPDFSSVSSLEECSYEQLLWLARQKGFGGVANVNVEYSQDSASPTRSVCTWYRHVDFQPCSGVPDAGFVYVKTDQDSTVMYEYGTSWDYKEIWRKIASPEQGLISLKLHHESNSDGSNREIRGFFVACDSRFIYIVERATPLPRADSLTQLIQNQEPSRQVLESWLDCVVIYGTCSIHLLDGSQYGLELHVELCTLPWFEGSTTAPQDFIINTISNTAKHSLSGAVRHFDVEQTTHSIFLVD
eukprot:TRINITY_DN14517_c0_g2_i2.p1 TRINITY_DN14517_c0_g2~~TRINITY_DN14517_c0_g2_i2.p1  ORF type:complete len:343 (-),score=30.60 TRINITY_DN14517_c0_g2_i2:87-1010(-)